MIRKEHCRINFRDLLVQIYYVDGRIVSSHEFMGAEKTWKDTREEYDDFYFHTYYERNGRQHHEYWTLGFLHNVPVTREKLGELFLEVTAMYLSNNNYDISRIDKLINQKNGELLRLDGID